MATLIDIHITSHSSTEHRSQHGSWGSTDYGLHHDFQHQHRHQHSFSRWHLFIHLFLLFMYVYVHVCVCIYVYVCMCVFMCVSICVCYMNVYIRWRKDYCVNKWIELELLLKKQCKSLIMTMKFYDMKQCKWNCWHGFSGLQSGK